MENSKLLASGTRSEGEHEKKQSYLFQEQVISLFPCSPSLLVPGATKLVPGTSNFAFSMLSLTACSRSK